MRPDLGPGQPGETHQSLTRPSFGAHDPTVSERSRPLASSSYPALRVPTGFERGRTGVSGREGETPARVCATWPRGLVRRRCHPGLPKQTAEASAVCISICARVFEVNGTGLDPRARAWRLNRELALRACVVRHERA